ncbi:MAG: PDZ domain-containing protein [Planctomycetes bacterium]|jgi:hypothetical protein|nr:PDZ domain-containing protein [Planctomycetota bacterium]MBT4028301.1 PDZ domain-containing protein [Planctomycetota bacterium]MBT4560906.1 PDZ domain-containing protein [Planctomycetota bacterium]MBT7012139.1 PDZ domain-containing protein [Planctomycetota bacterium]MBT7319354.1 PDZ domain-containing protein [Planctomycetota bacterium]
MVSYKLLRAIFVLVGLGALAGAGFTIYDFWLHKDTEYLAAFDVRKYERSFDVPEHEDEGHLRAYSAYDVLHKLEVAGKKEVILDDNAATEAAPPPRIGPDDLVLALVQFDPSDSNASAVFLRPAGEAVSQDGMPIGNLYALGDTVSIASKPGAQVEVIAIRATEVDLLLMDGEEPMFTLSTASFDVDLSRLNTAGSAESSSWREHAVETQMITPGHFDVGTNDIQTLSEMPQDELFAAVPLRVERDDKGKVRGLRVASLKDNSIFARQGLQADDILLSINGYATTDRSELLRWLRKQDSLETITVEVERYGAPRTLSYRLPR